MKRKSGIILPRCPVLRTNPKTLEAEWAWDALMCLIFRTDDPKTHELIREGETKVQSNQAAPLYRLLMKGENWKDGEWVGAMLHLVASIVASANQDVSELLSVIEAADA